MKVSELIQQLQSIEDKTKDVVFINSLDKMVEIDEIITYDNHVQLIEKDDE